MHEGAYYGAQQGMIQQQALQGQPYYTAQQGGAAYYGQQQAYGATQRQVYTAAQKARMPKEERKRIEKLEKEEAKRQRLERVRKQKMARAQKDANAFVIWMNLVLLFLGILLVLTMFGGTWCNKNFTGPGFAMLRIRSSLFTVEVEFECRKSFIGERKFCEALLPNRGTFNMHELQTHACAGYLNPSACMVMQRLYHASYPIFFSFSTAGLLNFAAAFCLYAYYFVSPHPKLRVWGSALVLLAPVVATIGFAVWLALCPDLAEIPHSWTYLVGEIPGIGDFIQITEMQNPDGVGIFQFGWTFFGAAIVVVFMYFQALAWSCFFQASADEDDVLMEEEEEQRYFAELEAEQTMGEDWKMYNEQYGSAPQGGQPAGAAAEFRYDQQDMPSQQGYKHT